MVDLFRYVEHDFVVPAPTDAIDVVNESDFQAELNDAAGNGTPSGAEADVERVRELADAYLTSRFASSTYSYLLPDFVPAWKAASASWR